MDRHIFDGTQEFHIGCNYWASHAGPGMWRDWRPEVVERDLRLLAGQGIALLRVFPNWRDFQPLCELAGYGNVPVEFRFGEEPLPDTAAGGAGVDAVMLERFRRFVRLAGSMGFRLIVSLVTGWMSGRMYVPPAFERRRLLTDPEVVQWQVRFVRTVVSELREQPEIAAWEPGNECNCMEPCTQSELHCWFMLICDAIRREDPARPVLSGTNSRVGGTQIPDMAEAADVLCVHAYAPFSKYCRVDPLPTMRNAFQAVFMARCCADIGRTAALVEEAGSLGPTQNGEEEAAQFTENLLWNAYAHDCRGVLWWCAFDQERIGTAPYDWLSLERELGLFRSDGSPKPAVARLKMLAELFRERPLPLFRRDAVCLLTEEQDQWGTAFLTFLLAKAAGFDLEFQFASEPLRPAALYLMPSVAGFRVLPRRRYLELLAAVERGASLYISSDDCGIEPFALFGAPIHTISERREPARIVSRELGFDFTVSCPHELRLGEGTAEVLAHDGRGGPAFTCAGYGRGRLLFLNVPLESALAAAGRLFEPGAPPYHRIYRLLAERSGIRRLAVSPDPRLTLTEHPAGDRVRLVAVNNSPQALQVTLALAPDWTARPGPELRLAPNSGALLELLPVKSRRGVPVRPELQGAGV